MNITVGSVSLLTSRAIVILCDLGFDGSPIVCFRCRGGFMRLFSKSNSSKLFPFRGDRRRISSRPGERDAEVVLPFIASTESPDEPELGIVGRGPWGWLGIPFR